MASAKDLKKKIHSIGNTSKITRTMEMVSAAKSKQTHGRVEANTPYSRKLSELLESLTGAARIEHPLFQPREGVARNALLVVSANRGLCGGYNTNVLNLMERWVAGEAARGRPTDITMLGKKGIARCRFKKIDLAARHTHIDDRPSFADADEIARGFIGRFLAGEVDHVGVVSTRYLSAATQRPAVVQILPIEPPQAPAGAARPAEAAAGKAAARPAGREFIFEPDPKTILEALLPFSVSQVVYRLLVEAAASEQAARRLAMKLATDNAEDLKKSYTRMYNRQRQASITKQIMEIVGGAEALA
jgi:F-type H+-transporting ATPase subunit gamma